MTTLQLYIAIIAGTVGVAIWTFSRKIKHLQQTRRERLKKQPDADSVPDFTTPAKGIQKQQIKRMEARFSITRRTIIAVLLFAGAGLSAIPFVAKISPAMLPVIMAVISVVIGI